MLKDIMKRPKIILWAILTSKLFINKPFIINFVLLLIILSPHYILIIEREIPWAENYFRIWLIAFSEHTRISSNKETSRALLVRVQRRDKNREWDTMAKGKYSRQWMMASPAVHSSTSVCRFRGSLDVVKFGRSSQSVWLLYINTTRWNRSGNKLYINHGALTLPISSRPRGSTSLYAEPCVLFNFS